MNHGEEIALTFDAASLPAVKPGMVRDFMFYAWGYGKDMDINSATPDTVGPMPSHGMPGYPPPAGETGGELLPEELATRTRSR
jgi:hypothetical protein